MKHEKLTHENCYDPNCNICELFVCKNCGGAEGTLPTECPGEQMSPETEQQVLEGEVDYYDGSWHAKQATRL